MAIRRAIRQMFQADRGRVLLSGTPPGAWRPVELAINGHGAPPRALARQWLGPLLAQEPTNAKPACARILTLEVQDLFEQGEAQLIRWMLRRTGPLVLQASKAIVGKGLQDGVDMRTRQLEARRNARLVPPLIGHADDRPPRLVSIVKGRKSGEVEFKLEGHGRAGQKSFERVMIGLVAKFALHNAHDFAQVDRGIQLFHRENVRRNSGGILVAFASSMAHPLIDEAQHALHDE